MRTVYVAILCCCISLNLVRAADVPAQAVTIPRLGKPPQAGLDRAVFKISFPKDLKLENALPMTLPVFRTARTDFTDEFMSAFSHAVCATKPDEIHRIGPRVFVKTAKGPFTVEFDRSAHYISIVRGGAFARRDLRPPVSRKTLSNEEMSKMARAVLDRHKLNYEGAIPIFWHDEESSRQVYVKVGRNAPGTTLRIINNSIDLHIARDGLLDPSSTVGRGEMALALSGMRFWG